MHGRVPRQQLVGGGILLLFAVVALVSAPESVLSLIERAVENPLWFALALVVLYLVRPILALPTMAAAAVVGYGYGIAVGIPVALLGTTLSSILPYLVGRHFRSTDGLLGWLCAHGDAYFDVAGDVRGIVAARLAPTPSDPVSYAAGLAQVPLRPFLLGTAIGELHWTILAVVAGASLRELTAGTLPSFSPIVLIAATLAALVVLAGPIHRRVVGISHDRAERRADGDGETGVR